MRTESLFELVYILLEKKSATARELSAHFGVSTRTVHRWVDALSVAGIPVYAVQGKGGGIRIAEDFALDKAVLSDGEKNAVLSAVNALNALSLGTEQATLSKLRSLGRPGKEQDTDWLQIDFAPWNPEHSDVRALFETLKRAILEKRQVAFDYFSSSGTRLQDARPYARTAQPWKLVFRQRAWYLFAWCNAKKEARYFKLNRMRNVRALSAPITALQKDAGAGALPKPYTNHWLKSAEQKRLVLRAAGHAAHLILDEYRAERVEPQDDGTVRITLSVPDFAWLPEIILGFGTSVEVLSPPDLRARVAALAERVAGVYKKKAGPCTL